MRSARVLARAGRLASSCALVCGLGAWAPLLAQQATFEYSAVARLLQDGNFRAEIWRRELASDRSDIAWSSNEPSPNAVEAVGEACQSLQQNFDASFPCPRVASAVTATEHPPAKAKAAPRPRAGTTAAAVKAQAPQVPVQTQSQSQAQPQGGPTAHKPNIAQAAARPTGSPTAASVATPAGTGPTWAKTFLRDTSTHSGGE
jgi:hypothetical protein